MQLALTKLGYLRLAIRVALEAENYPEDNIRPDRGRKRAIGGVADALSNCPAGTSGLRIEKT